MPGKPDSGEPDSGEPEYSVRRLRRDRLILAGLVALFLVGAIGVASGTDWHAILGQIARLSVVQVAILLGLSAINYFLRGLRWHILVQSLGLHPRFLGNLIHFLGGFAMSVTPGRVGELVRIRWLARDSGVSVAHAAPVVLGDRAADLVAMALLLGGALCFVSLPIRGAVPVAILAFVGAVVVTQPTLAQGAVSIAYRLFGRHGARLFARARTAARRLSRFTHARVFVPALLCGLAGWSAEALAFHLLLGWFGAPVSFATALAIFIFATLAGGLTGAPGGLGGAEAAMVALLALGGAPFGTAVAATVLIRATTLWFAVAIGILAFPLAERGTIRGTR